MKKAKLTIFAGPMYSGKTTKLIKLVEILESLGEKVLTVKPSIDTRYTSKPLLASHDKKTAKAVFINKDKPEEILAIIDSDGFTHVILDELNFFDSKKTIPVVKKLLKRGIGVTGSGLAFDYRRKVFGPTLKLAKMADKTVWLYAICQRCGQPAEHTERVSGGKEQVVVAGMDMYIATCRKCHRVYEG